MLTEEFRRRVEMDFQKFSLIEIKNVINDMIENNIDLGSTLYKICPKCNENHNGDCNHCAWQGTMRVCDVGVRVWGDGSYNKNPLQIVTRKFGNTYDLDIFKLWNIQYFPSYAEAEKALKEYDEIRNIADKTIRKLRYNTWEFNRRAFYTYNCD